MNIVIAASWKQRDHVRTLANQIRNFGHVVYDFTDPTCRKTKELSPETYPERFDSNRHDYWEYLNKYPEYKLAVNENKEHVLNCDIVVLLLPCGIDATADWAVGVGSGKFTIIVGSPNTGERSPVHLWTNLYCKDDETLLRFLSGLYVKTGE